MIGAQYFGEYSVFVGTGGGGGTPTVVLDHEDVTVIIHPHDPDGDSVDPTTVTVTVDNGGPQHMNTGPSSGQFQKALHLSGIPGANVTHTVHFEAADMNAAGSLIGSLDIVVIVSLPIVTPPPPPTPPPIVLLPGPTPKAVVYTVVHYDHNGNQVCDYEPADLSFGSYANQAGYFNGILHLQSRLARRTFAEPHVHDWVIYRNNVPLLGGVLTGVSTDSDSRILNLAGSTWESYLDAVVMPYNQNNPIDKHYYNKDLFFIAENITSYILNAYQYSLNLTLANGTSGIKIAAQHMLAADLNSLLQILTDLGAQSPGYDFEVTWDQQLKLYTPQKGTYLDFTLSLASDNITQWHYELSGVRGTTEYGRGTPAAASSQLVIRQDSGSDATYRHRDTIVDYSTVASQNQLARIVNSDLQDALKQTYSFKITLQNPPTDIHSAVSWGDYIKVDTDGLMDYDNFTQEYFRVTSVEGYMNDRGTEQVVFTLGQEHG